MEYEDDMLVRWNPETNIFYDQCGFKIDNIFDLITPNDLFLFRQDPGYCTFPYRNDRSILIELIVEDDEEIVEPEYTCQFEGNPCWFGRTCSFFDSLKVTQREICNACSGR